MFKKIYLLAAAALGMASVAQMATPTPYEKTLELITVDDIASMDALSWPVSPKSDSTKAEHQVEYAPRQMRPLSYGYVPRYSDQARPRRVKYGKSRWVVLS